MPAWIWVLAACAVGWVVFVAVFHPFKRGQHAAPRALPVRVDAGSMVLAEERTAWLSAPTLTAMLLEGRDDSWQPLETAPLAPLDGQLGPRARAVLDRYNARCVERWGHAIAG